jgi:hypothetical protein
MSEITNHFVHEMMIFSILCIALSLASFCLMLNERVPGYNVREDASYSNFQVEMSTDWIQNEIVERL